jgi:hypothetical protein
MGGGSRAELHEEEGLSMPFESEPDPDARFGPYFGRYLKTFQSVRGQVLAHLFDQDGWLVAHVSMPTGLGVDKITDPYLDDLHQFAREADYGRKFRITYDE